MKKLYLASPLGFSEAGRTFLGGTLIPFLERLGYVVLDPWALAEEGGAVADESENGLLRSNALIGTRNVQSINEADFLFAVLDGPDVDSGTAAEIGYACALGKPVLGYRGDIRVSAENRAGIVNLQVEHFVRMSGGALVTNLDSVPRALEQISACSTKRRDVALT